MKTAIYFMKLCGTGAMAFCGFIVFLCELIGDAGTAAGAFRGLALMGFGAFLLAYVLETCKCPIQIKISKAKAPATEEAPAVEAAPATEAAE